MLVSAPHSSSSPLNIYLGRAGSSPRQNSDPPWNQNLILEYIKPESVILLQAQI